MINNARPYQLLIFDWDGTLMDSAAHISVCLQNAFRALQLPPPSTAAVRDIIGLSLADAIPILYQGADQHLIAALTDEYRQEFLVRNSEQSALFEGAWEVLHDLQAAGYYLAVATGKSRRSLSKVLQESGLDALFPITRCADETRSKPHPLMLEQILTDYNCAASQALMIGDTEYDLLMAQAIKMDALAVSYGVHERSRLLPLASGCIDDIRALPSWLAQQNKS